MRFANTIWKGLAFLIDLQFCVKGTEILKRITKRGAPSLVKFVPAFPQLFCLALPWFLLCIHLGRPHEGEGGDLAQIQIVSEVYKRILYFIFGQNADKAEGPWGPSQKFCGRPLCRVPQGILILIV